MAETIEERLRRLREQKAQQQSGQSIEERLAALRGQPPPQEAPSFLGNVVNAAQQGYVSLKDKAAGLGEIIGGAAGGDFRPAIEAAQGIVRGAAPIVSALGRPDAGPRYLAEAVAQAGPLAEIQAQQDARRASRGDTSFRSRADEMARLEAQARALDSSLSGRITRGVVREGIKLAPTLIAGAVSGGSVPAIAGATALSSFDEPENLVANTALAALPISSGRAIKSAVSPAVQVLEAEAQQAGGGLIRATGAAVDEAAIRAASLAAPLEAQVAKAAVRSPWQDVVLSYYRGNLLTNPAGRASDLGGTLINQFPDAAARPIAAAVDVVVSKLTGVRSISGLSVRGTGRAFGSIRQGFRDAKEVLKTGKQALDSGADDALYGAEMLSGLGKAVDLPVNGVFRILGALDAPFRRFGYARNLYDRARVAAINEAKRGEIPWDKLTARTRDLLDDGDIIRAAVRDGEAAVLSEPNVISSWLAAQTHSSPNARLAIGLVQPFMRIPLNAVLKAADFSGLGGVKALYKIARGVGRKTRAQSFFRDLEDQRIFSQNVASGSFGVAGFLLGMELEQQGKLEGYYYTSKRDYPNGKIPTSINLGGENYDINRLGGFIAAPLFIGATFNRLRKQDVGAANSLLRSFSGLVQTAPALGYYGVPAKAGRLLTSDNPADVLLQEAGSTASGFIPASGAMGYAAKAFDSEKKRETDGFTGPIMNRVPGLRQRLPVKEERRRKR